MKLSVKQKHATPPPKTIVITLTEKEASELFGVLGQTSCAVSIAKLYDLLEDTGIEKTQMKCDGYSVSYSR